MINAKLIAYTQPTIAVGASNPEELISFCARVSNPSNQENYDTAEGLLKYCIKNKHWSIFGMANAIVEIEAPRDISRQVLRHSSMTPQEFSYRYSDGVWFTTREVRMQDTKNRQNSFECTDLNLIKDWEDGLGRIKAEVDKFYKEMLSRGVAKECARAVLPEGLTMSRLYMNGSLRSWLHYLEVREDISTQKEHRMLANKIREVLEPVFPTVLSLTNADTTTT